MLKKWAYNLNLNLGKLERHYIMAQTEKLFTVAGTASQNGITKARFANDLVARIKILNKAGCDNINLVELPKPMTKLEALQYLESTGNYTGDAGYAVANKLAEKTKIAKRAEIKVQVAPKAKAKVADTADKVEA
jgi:L-aminopeptidase/D-esterase-like protein